MASTTHLQRLRSLLARGCPDERTDLLVDVVPRLHRPRRYPAVRSARPGFVRTDGQGRER